MCTKCYCWPSHSICPLTTATLCTALCEKLMEGWVKRREKNSGHCLDGCQGGTRGPNEEHGSITPGANAGFRGMELLTHLKDDLSWYVEAGGRAAAWEEHPQLHHWQMVLLFLELPCRPCSSCYVPLSGEIWAIPDHAQT